MSDKRVTLQQREDGGWYAECGCRFDYWEGRPEAVAPGVLKGTVAPHVHLCKRHSEATNE